MKTRGYCVLLIAIATVTFSLTDLATDVWSQEQTHHKIAEIVKAEAKYDLFSGTVLVAKDGVIHYASAFGEENKEYHVPNVLETRFNISSIQKTFIATVVMQLHQEGRISLDDPLTKYYPDCPFKTAGEIRIRHLLNHTSGLGDYRDSDEYRVNADRYTCIDDVLPHIWRSEPAFAPGERPRYSNAGVLLIKGIIERVTEKKLGEALQERIFDPLGMDNTTMYVSGDLLQHRATAYRLSADGETYVRVTDEPSAYSGGGIYTTVLDLLSFDQALYGEQLLTEETKQIMFTPVAASPNYAYGWILDELNGTQIVYHSGGSGGFNSEFRRYPENGYTVIVLANYEEGAYELANKIERLLLGMDYALATETDMYYRRGLVLQRHEAYDAALKLFEKNALAASPHLPSLYQCARTRIMGEFDLTKAIEALDRYISLADESRRPSIAAAWWRKGIAYEQLGQIDQAIACHERCLEIDKGWEEAEQALARLRGKR